jgi:hypothetical protein
MPNWDFVLREVKKEKDDPSGGVVTKFLPQPGRSNIAFGFSAFWNACLNCRTRFLTDAVVDTIGR